MALGRLFLAMTDNVNFTFPMVVITTLNSPDGCDYNSLLPMVVITTLHLTPDCCDYNTAITITSRASHAPHSWLWWGLQRSLAHSPWRELKVPKNKTKMREKPNRVKYIIVLCTHKMKSKAAERRCQGFTIFRLTLPIDLESCVKG